MMATKLLPAGGIQTGLFTGLSVLALVTAMDMTNGGLYAALMQQYGTQEEAGAFVLTSIESGPLVSMLILGATGVAVFEPLPEPLLRVTAGIKTSFDPAGIFCPGRLYPDF